MDWYNGVLPPLFGTKKIETRLRKANDNNSDINPGADEVWYDGIDQDCDGNDDDQDADGWSIGDDCDDTDAQIYVCDTALDSGLAGAAKGGGGCGCDGTGGVAGGLLALFMLTLTRRRRS